ncbi:glycerate kinase [Georgenia sp. SYP-B2076]|uniref:glycerate kinase n=1 Tax=Georgenia sp. SYP-B2076 TaxID=2495881 RepID=UPI0013E01E75|nr:glycerate kinase [Georgenia sp. SYP-B2076]
MRILLAPDRFSGTLTAVEAAAALGAGWAQAAPDDAVTAVAMSDGSAGLLDVVAAARGGRLVPMTVPGPLGAPVPAAVLHVPGGGGGTAYVEADQAIGPHLVPEADRRRAAERGTSAGVGHLLAAAVRTGASRVVVGLGAAAVHDAGAGLLSVLAGGAGTAGMPSDAGADAFPSAGPGPAGTLGAGGLALAGLTPADTEALAAVRDRLVQVDLLLAVADDAPLLGLHGAGAVLGQDPAVGPAAAQDLERALGHATDLLERRAATLGDPRRGWALRAAAPGHEHAPRTPAPLALADAPGRAPATRLARRGGTGAGGGTAFLLQLLGGRVLPGADVVADAVGLRAHVAKADLVVTGGQLLDAPSLTGSVTATVARLAMERGLPVVVVAEEVRASRREAAQAGISATYEVLDRRRDGSSGKLHGAAHARDRLTVRGARVARTWSA